MTISPPDAVIPLISIVIPTRNRPELLQRALQSIASQTFVDFEVIVIDDGSDEASYCVYETLWQSLDARFIFHPLGVGRSYGLGPSVTRNIGITLARGQILAFCDDDDFWTAPHHLLDMAAAFNADPAVDMYIANQTGVSSHGIEISNWFPRLTTKMDSREKQTGAKGIVTIEELCAAGGFAHLNVLSIRRQLALDVQGFWERVSYEEDRDFFWRVLDRCHRIYFNPAIVAQHNIPDAHRVDNQSTQHSIVDRWLLATLVCQHIATNVGHPSIAVLVRGYEGDILRKLTLHFKAAGRIVLAFDFGRRALAARFSFKWSAYLMMLGLKAIRGDKAL
jgi:glycosyltransferase involved in cell wall biosynthesis